MSERSERNRDFLRAEQVTLKALIAETSDGLGRRSLEHRLAQVEEELADLDAAPEGCEIVHGSSRTCKHGTRSCEVRH